MSNWKQYREERREIEKGVLSRIDGAEYLDVSVRTFDKYIASDLIKGYTLPGGRMTKYRKTDLEDFISGLNS